MNFTQNRKSSDRFNAISLKIASPERIREWSYGEVTKPETINYRTQKPERDGLFCERIFGPIKNWECYCGKYKKIRYKGVICEKCGVEVTRAIVRRERMGHISLAVPVAHTWFLRSTPSRLGLILDLPVKQLEQVVYFASYIIISVDEVGKQEALNDLEQQFKTYKKKAHDEFQEKLQALRHGAKTQDEAALLEAEEAKKMQELKESYESARKELEAIKAGQIMSELGYREASMKFGHVFKAGTGAESVRAILEMIDLEAVANEMEEKNQHMSGQKQKKMLRRIRFLTSLRRAAIRPEWMIMTELPVLPPDLRPMVQLDGGRFAASDLNDLYRRIINRNNRLKRLMAIGAPEVICRNEKRMLQEAVDTLLNNSTRGGRAVFTAGDRRKLRSLSDMLKGKQGRFRQNLLGKRVDYSGRSVIVVGPELELHQCGLPKEIAMKLFKPFVIGELIRGEFAHNVKGAEKIINARSKYVWDILAEVIKGKYVLLNRAPTLHRLGIQAFAPVLIEGKAIQVHPLVCAAFNADFDGDQMAVHLPLSAEAQREAREIMLSSQNLLKPSSGEPIVTPTQDMILGIYYLTQVHPGKVGEGLLFTDTEEAILAHDLGYLDLQALIRVRTEDGEIRETSLGRLLFNRILPECVGYLNKAIGKNQLESLIADVFDRTDIATTAHLTDAIKKLGFEYATRSGVSIGVNDMKVPVEKEQIVSIATEKVLNIGNQYWKGLITENERYNNAIKIWAQAKSDVAAVMIQNYKKTEENDIYYMIDSGARGNWGQVTQLSGMKGLVASPSGRTIELPIKANLKEGFSILEYFIATHGGRKGKSDTALKTAEAGYLTRRLVDAVQDIIIKEADCGSEAYHEITQEDSEKVGEKFERRIFGRTLAAPLVDPKTGEIFAERNEEIGNALLATITQKNIKSARVRSIMNCETAAGICQKCYGRDLGTNKTVEIGTPVGIIAAQSIGEPGTQLTMRTFHMGGVAEGADITQGLTRVEELFEARPPKTPAVLSDIAGKVTIEHEEREVNIHIRAEELGEDIYPVEENGKVSVKVDDMVKENQILVKGHKIIRVQHMGKVTKVEKDRIVVKHAQKLERSYSFRSADFITVENGQFVEVGTALTYGHYNLRELMEKTDVYTVQKYITNEVQSIYASQGQTINDKHIEIIVNQMFSRVRIMEPGDLHDMLPGETMDYQKVRLFSSQNPEKKHPTFERLLLGLTRIALATDSWLSAASFQETIRVLVNASTTGKVDTLDGLKENVIIGKLIPAGSIYRKQFFTEKQKEDETTAS